MQNKPVQYLFTDLWGLSMASIWQTISIIVGIIFIDLSDVITFHIGAIFMFCGAYYISNFLHKEQYKNREKLLRKDWDFSIALVWWTSVVLTLIFVCLTILSFFNTGGNEGSLFFYSLSIFPFGAAINTSKKWELRKDFES
ncbi:hypothetical protein GYB29_11895 [bacterium]|jgi:putative Mn2+ efflux pump MntP|nr:hypothetical protein [bacterium]